MVLDGIRQVLSDNQPIRSNSLCVCLKRGIALVVFVKMTKEVKYASCA